MSNSRCTRRHEFFPCNACRDLDLIDEGKAEGITQERARVMRHVEAYHSGAVSLNTLIALISRPNAGE